MITQEIAYKLFESIKNSDNISLKLNKSVNSLWCLRKIIIDIIEIILNKMYTWYDVEEANYCFCVLLI